MCPVHPERDAALASLVAYAVTPDLKAFRAKTLKKEIFSMNKKGQEKKLAQERSRSRVRQPTATGARIRRTQQKKKSGRSEK